MLVVSAGGLPIPPAACRSRADLVPLWLGGMLTVLAATFVRSRKRSAFWLPFAGAAVQVALAIAYVGWIDRPYA